MKLLAIVSVAGLALLAPIAMPQQEVARLQQEVNNLKFRLDYETDRLERRLEGLERQVQQAQSRAPVSTIAPPVVAVPVPTGDEIVVRRLVVTDDSGNIRGVLGVSDTFGPMLGLLNARGDVVGLFAAPDEGSRLELFDAAATRRVLLGHQDGAVLELSDRDGETTVRLPPEQR